MSTELRVISGSSAAWARIVVTMFSQLALVPLYLTHWNIETYGIWIAVQALANVLSTLDFGHQTYLEFEFLRIGKDRREELSRYLSSGVFIGLCLSIFQILLITICLVSGLLPCLLTGVQFADQKILHDAGFVLLLQGVVWLISSSMTGLFSRALSPLGYYARMSWWGVFNAVLSMLAPAVAVVLGADLLVTSFVTSAITISCSCLQYIDIFHLFRKEQITFCKPSLKLGFRNLHYSIGLSGRNLLENTRQQGIRLILAPLSGASGLVTFSTMRTGANVALQGISSIIYPIMPELMRFLHQRDQKRIDATFGIVWIVVVALLVPSVVILQAFIKPLYFIWTKGQIAFQPWLFALLSQAVLVYALAQPSIAVVKGNNLLKPQLSITALAATTLIISMWILVPGVGIVGAGISLLLAEVTVAVGYRVVARRWMKHVGLSWPRQSFHIASHSVWISVATMGAIIWWPQAKWFILISSLFLLYWNLWRFWKVLPELVTERARKIVASFPLIRKLLAV